MHLIFNRHLCRQSPESVQYGLVDVISKIEEHIKSHGAYHIEEQGLPAVLVEYHVDRKAFSKGMRTKFQDLLGQLSNGGYLTADQRNQILTQIDQYAERRTLMKGLIDKALTDGTITPDQAQTLMKRPR